MGEELRAEYAEGFFPRVAEGAHSQVTDEVEVVVPVGEDASRPVWLTGVADPLRVEPVADVLPVEPVQGLSRRGTDAQPLFDDGLEPINALVVWAVEGSQVPGGRGRRLGDAGQGRRARPEVELRGEAVPEGIVFCVGEQKRHRAGRGG